MSATSYSDTEYWKIRAMTAEGALARSGEARQSDNKVSISATLRKTTEQMASTCSVPISLWCEHSSAVLKAADQIERSQLTAEEAWQDLIETSDVTSPAEYPNHALITFEKLRDYMSSALSTPTSQP